MEAPGKVPDNSRRWRRPVSSLSSPAQHRSAPIARPPLQPTGPLHPIPTTATTHPPAAPHSARRELVGKPARYWLRVTWVPGDRAPKSRIPPRPASPLPACEKRISTGVETSQEANRREVRLGFSTFLRCGRWRCHPRYSFVIPPPGSHLTLPSIYIPSVPSSSLQFLERTVPSHDDAERRLGRKSKNPLLAAGTFAIPTSEFALLWTIGGAKREGIQVRGPGRAVWQLPSCPRKCVVF